MIDGQRRGNVHAGQTMKEAEPQVFDVRSWLNVGFMTFVAVGGISFLTSATPGFVVLGAALLILGLTGVVAWLGSGHLEVSDAGVTTRRFFRWSHTYPRSDLHHATTDWKFGGMPFSVPVLVLNSGREVRLWSVNTPTLFRFGPNRHTTEIVQAINHHLAYRADFTD